MSRFDRFLSLRDRSPRTGIEIEAVTFLQERLDRPQRGGWIFIPGRQHRIRDTFRPHAIFAEHGVETGEPGRRCSAGQLQGREQLAGSGAREDRSNCPGAVRLFGKPPERAVALHHLGVVTLKEFRDLCRTNAVLAAHSVEAEIVSE